MTFIYLYNTTLDPKELFVWYRERGRYSTLLKRKVLTDRLPRGGNGKPWERGRYSTLLKRKVLTDRAPKRRKRKALRRWSWGTGMASWKNALELGFHG